MGDTVESLTKALEALTKKLVEDQETYRNAETVQARASSNLVSALNKLNNTQKEIDKIINKIKTLSPSDTDWRQDAKKKERIEGSLRNV